MSVSKDSAKDHPTVEDKAGDEAPGSAAASTKELSAADLDKVVGTGMTRWGRIIRSPIFRPWGPRR
jgi:hypothetical protein